MNFVFIGLSISSSWGNGHATTYRSLIKALHSRGHRILFLERDQPWYARNRDLPEPEYCQIAYYQSREELRQIYARQIRDAHCVVLGSYVDDGIEIGRWLAQVTEGVYAFYDIDTPVTLAQLEEGFCPYLSRELIPRFDLYLSFSGGPVLELLQEHYGARQAVPLYCSADPGLYAASAESRKWSLGYLGTYSVDRQPALEEFLLEPARRLPQQWFAAVGPMYPESIAWPANVERKDHLDPSHHAVFYGAQRFTLNVTRLAMRRIGYSPSVRLFEAAACGVPVITDDWEGLESFFTPGQEILVARSADDVEGFLRDLKERERNEIARRARERFLLHHTPEHRAAELEAYVGPFWPSLLPLKSPLLEEES